MLLPSDIARLVLGYLQQEKLSSTCQAFILESGDLKEYAEHSTEDGVVPACLLSLFGKNLKTILNEYVVMKARDSMPEAPAVLPSLWRKLEYTLSQIRSLQQSSVALATNQRARTKNALNELRRRGNCSSRQVSRANSSLLSISPQTEQRIIIPLSANPVVIAHSSGASPVIPQPRPDVYTNQFRLQDASRPATNPSGDALHIVVPGPYDRRLQPEHVSPGKRKCDSPRKRSGFVSGQNSTSRSVENEVEESQVEIFPQRVIENAREKILKDRSLLEKLAENINKVMFSETSTGHPSKPPDSSTSLPDQSIDEILGLGDEVHMTDEAIQDILEQTESDPAFQALFDLFDYGKSKRSEDSDHGQSSQEDLEIIENNASSAFSDTFNTFQTEELGNVVSLPSTVSEKASSDYKKKSKADGTIQKNKISPESNSTTKSKKKENQILPTFSTADVNKSMLSTVSQISSIQASKCSHWTTGEASSVSDIPSSVAVNNTTTLVVSESQGVGDVAEMEIEAQSPSIYHETAELSPLVQQKLSEGPMGIEELTNHNEKTESLSKLTCQNGFAAEANDKSSFYANESKAVTSQHELEEVAIKTVCDINANSETATVVCNVPPSNRSEALLQSTFEAQKSSECVPASLEGRKPSPVDSDNSSVTAMPDQQTVVDIPGISRSPSLTNTLESQALVSSVPEASNNSAVSSSSVNSLKSGETETCIVSAEVELPDRTELVSSSVSSSKSSSEVKTASLQLSFVTSGLNLAAESISTTMVSKSPLPTTSAKSDVISTSKVSNAEPSSTMEVDPANIVTLKIIISDDPKQSSSDTELSNAVSSITNENVPTIILSSPGGTPLKGKGSTQPLPSSSNAAVTETISSRNECVSTEETESAINSLGMAEEPESSKQNVAPAEVEAVPTQSVTSNNVTVTIPQTDGALLSTQNPISLSKDTGLIQLLPAATMFGQSSSVLIATCVQDSAGQPLRKGDEPNNSNTFILDHRGNSTNVLMLPSSSASATISTSVPQALSTPPRTSTVFTMGQPVPSSFSQGIGTGSTFIITSPVQPVLQGMMGMIPVSIMGLSSGASSTASPQQVLRMPVSSSLGKKCSRFSKLPISRKLPQLAVQPSTLNTGQSSVIGTFISIDSSITQSSSQPQRGGNSDQNVPVDQVGKSRERPMEISNASSSISSASSSKLRAQRHRRVLCFDNATSTESNQPNMESNTSQDKKENHADNKSQPDRPFSSQIKERSERTDTRVSKGREIQGKSEKSKNSSSGPSYDSFHKATANKENEASRDQVRQRSRETSDLSNTQMQKKGSQSERPNSKTDITDKDGVNKIPESQQEFKKGITALAVSQETASKRNPDKSDSFSLTSTLTKQAAEMLQDMQRQSPAPKQTSNADLPVPRTPGSNVHEGPDDCSDFQRTPQNKGFGDEKASPRVMAPPTTPDIPACSPASEAGSENSVSMAAHTLMILSRAAIARTTGTTPLKDNTCQIRSPLSQTKKRKLEEREEEYRQLSLSSKTDLQNSSSPGRKKRSKSHKHKRKKHLDSFPVEMDVDKFLSSLQYDE
ncbi:protein NPAT isoform X2 [Heptranchias perlo]|uniref:protein NPAT isoform X2 n=1 Tax=Heptranchias perlo TaxID=212740 RepID=UPI00355A5761